ncbi:MAG: EamA family transporter [Candidatus Wolfebacteria bacterium]|nr:EamA family transporter [Candidatus Wolfebacteria bacterium]
MLWIFISAASYFLTAVTSITDKFLVSRRMPSPAVFSFFVGILSITALVLAPFGFFLPPTGIILTAFLSGFLFLSSLFCFYSALNKNEASRIATIAGVMTPIFSLTLGYFIFGEKLNEKELIAFAILLIGGILISAEKEGFSWKIKGFWFVLLSVLFLASSFAAAKLVYLNQPFINGYIWTRIGIFLAAFLLIIPRRVRRLVFETGKNAGARTGAILIGNKALGGLALILLNYSFTLTSIGLVNALQGLQYSFLFILALILSHKFPHILKEETRKRSVIQKVIAIIIIAVGLGVLAL